MPRSSPTRAALLLAVLVVAVAGETRADTPAPTPPPIPAPLEPDMARMRDMIRNATVKLRSSTVGIRGDATRPALVCCSMNIEAIHDSSRILDAKLDDLAKCYEHESDSQMRANAEFARADVAGVRQSLASFSEAADPQLAGLAAAALSKSYLLLLDTLGKLRSCPAESSASSTGKSGKQKKEKKKKGQDAPPQAD